MTPIQRGISAIALIGVFGFSTILAPIAANASEEGRRNTVIGIGAAALAALLLSQNKHHGRDSRADRYDSNCDNQYDQRYNSQYDNNYDSYNNTSYGGQYDRNDYRTDRYPDDVGRRDRGADYQSRYDSRSDRCNVQPRRSDTRRNRYDSSNGIGNDYRQNRDSNRHGRG